MKAKTARRWFTRNQYKIAKERVMTSWFGYSHRKKYKPLLTALRQDQSNPASQRVYQRFLRLCS